MARGSEGKARRKEQRKKAKEDAEALLNANSHDFGPVEDEGEDLPTPDTNVGEDGDDDSEDDLGIPPPRKGSRSGEDKDQLSAEKKVPPLAGGKKGIKTTPLILLVLMTGTTLLPGLIFASDYIGAMLQKHHVLGAIGYKLGFGTTPKKRVLSFYEKHDPSKVEDVPKILAKYYGDYPTLTKKLERKYQDYGYFLDWEKDEAPMTLAFEQLHETRMYLLGQWNHYAPQPLKTAARNVQYNVGTLVKKGRKIWKKVVWPYLEPIFGVPKGAAAQKRKDAQEARNRKAETGSGGSKRRRRNTEYRDDIEEET